MKYEIELDKYSDVKNMKISIKLKSVPSDDDAKDINSAITTFKNIYEKYTKENAE